MKIYYNVDNVGLIYSLADGSNFMDSLNMLTTSLDDYEKKINEKWPDVIGIAYYEKMKESIERLKLQIEGLITFLNLMAATLDKYVIFDEEFASVLSSIE